MRLRRNWILTLATLALAAPAAAEHGKEPDLSGTWTMTIEGKAPPGKNFASLTFSGEGDEISVTMSGKGGELQDRVEIDGDEIRFEHAPPGKKASVAVFSGRIHGDLMGGEVDMGKRGKTAWQAIREGDNVFNLTGTWTFFQQGLPRDYTNLTKLHFHQEGHDLVATFTTGDDEIACRGYLDGESLGFEYSRTTEGGESFSGSYEGKVSGDMMRGAVEMTPGGKSTWQATRDDG